MSTTEPGEELIYDWNTVGDDWRPAGTVMLDDETLRDGLQSPSVTDPPLATKLELIHLMDELGIDTADVGLPGAGPRAVADVTAICKEIARAKLNIKANCAARTHANRARASTPGTACPAAASSSRAKARNWPRTRVIPEVLPKRPSTAVAPRATMTLG